MMNQEKNLAFVLIANCILAATLSTSATSEIIATRQVSTLDISPLIYAQVFEGDPFAKIGGFDHYVYTQLYTPSVDDGQIAFISASSRGGYLPGFLTDAGLFVIADLDPQISPDDGRTNRNVRTLGHGVTDASTGVFDNFNGNPNQVEIGRLPNSLSFDSGKASSITATATEFVFYEGAASDESVAPVTPLDVILDRQTAIPSVPGYQVVSYRNLDIHGQEVRAISRDGQRTVLSVGLRAIGSTQGPVHEALVSHENGVITTLAVSPFLNDGLEIDLPGGVPFTYAQYIDADNGRFAMIDGEDRLYLFDESDQATFLVSGGDMTNVTLDGDDVVVGRGFASSVDPRSINTRNTSMPIPFLLPSSTNISRVENGGYVDLVNGNTVIPGTSETFAGFGIFDYSEGNLAFKGSGGNGTGLSGLFVLYQGAVHEIVSFGDTFDGKTVTEIDFSREGLDGDLLAFVLTFAEPSGEPNTRNQSIYTLSLAENFAIPEPATWVLLACFVVGGQLGTRRRRIAQEKKKCQN